MDETEEIFKPRPGGMVDTARKAAQAAPTTDDAEVQDQDYTAIRVADQAADVFAARSVTIAAGGSALLIPEDRNRKRASLSVDTATSSVVLSPQNGNTRGYTLTTGMVLPVESKGLLYAYNPGTASVTISVLSELYAPGV